MRISANWLQRQFASGLVVLLAVPLTAQTQQPLPSQQEGTSSVEQAQPQTPDQTSDHAAGRPAAQTNSTVPEGPSSTAPLTNNTNQASPQTPTQPVGTAAAPYEKTLGAASSRPAGAVIAPAKQRRSHSLLIKVGLIVGGAAAIGTVVALSKASPNRPN